jgi:beta-N-acetylhexosaminidase
LSPAIVDRWLKRDLGFSGVVVSDDLGMKAIAATRPLPEASVDAIVAGCDAVLFCNHAIDEQVAALEALIRAVESGRIPMTRLDDAMRRQQEVKARVRPPRDRPRVTLDVVGSVEHQAVAEAMAAWR